MDMPTFVLQLLKTLISCFARVNITLAARNVRLAVPDTSRRLGVLRRKSHPLSVKVTATSKILPNCLSQISCKFCFTACNCFGHSNECEYDEEVDKQKLSLDMAGNYEGGGVCKNCRHNTEGINCNKCKPGYYRPRGKSWNDVDVCQRMSFGLYYFKYILLVRGKCLQIFPACSCNYHWSTGNCEEETGQCECAPAYLAPRCDACNIGYYDYPYCKPCECHYNGTQGGVCEVGGGQCPCKANYAGKNCDRCADGYYNFPDCLRKLNSY